jgi:hypothetical protein
LQRLREINLEWREIVNLYHAFTYLAMTIPTYPMPTLHELNTYCRLGNLTRHIHVYTQVQYVIFRI